LEKECAKYNEGERGRGFFFENNALFLDEQIGKGRFERTEKKKKTSFNNFAHN